MNWSEARLELSHVLNLDPPHVYRASTGLGFGIYRDSGKVGKIGKQASRPAGQQASRQAGKQAR